MTETVNTFISENNDKLISLADFLDLVRKFKGENKFLKTPIETALKNYDRDDFLQYDEIYNPFKLNPDQRQDFLKFGTDIRLLDYIETIKNYFYQNHWNIDTLMALTNDEVSVKDLSDPKEIVSNFGSWSINKKDKILLPSLASYWNNNKFELLTEIKSFEIREEYTGQKESLILLKPKFLVDKFITILSGIKSNCWKDYFQPLIISRVTFNNYNQQSYYGRNVFCIIYYNFLFNSFVARIVGDGIKDVLVKNIVGDENPNSDFKLDKFFKLNYLNQIGNRNFVRQELKRATRKELGDLNFSDYQCVHSNLPVGNNYWIYKKTSYKKMLLPSINHQDLSLVLNKILPKNVQEILNNSKSFIESEIEKFPSDIKDEAMKFKNIENINNSPCIYLLLGRDKNFKDNHHWLLKVGRTENFKQRAVLYQSREKGDSNQFKRSSVVTIINALKLDELPIDIDSLTLQGAEAMFRNMLKQIQAPIYGNEWFDGNIASTRIKVINEFSKLKEYINNNPNIFYDLIHEPRKTKIANFIASRMKNKSAEEVLEKYRQSRGD